MNDKDLLREQIFNELQQIANEWIKVGYKITRLQETVQNEDYITPENWHLAQELFESVALYINQTPTDVKEMLAEEFNKIYELYKGDMN